MYRLETLPNFNRDEKKIFKAIIIILFLLAVIICIKDNGYKVLAVMGENYEDSLPIYSVNTEEQILSITFDAAWGDEDLEEILQILNAHDCKATFFVTGDWATRYPDAVKDIVKNGHDVGNHGANHKHMTALSREEMIAEIEGCHNIVKTISGYEMDLFRAPYGDYNESVILAAKAKNYYTVQWDVDSLDWKDYGADSIVNTVCNNNNLKNGSIVLLHNGSKYTAEALDELLTNLEKKGYKFVPVSKLIYREQYSIDHTGRQNQ